MEAPFEATTWDGIAGAIYTGAGGAEWIWIVLSLLCILVALVGGWRHEDHAYQAVQNRAR